MFRVPLTCAALAAALAPLAPATAEDCYGLDAARVCVTLYPENFPTVDPHGSSIEECVHVGSSCTPVSVPVPTVELSENRLVSVGCYFGSRNCVERT